MIDEVVFSDLRADPAETLDGLVSDAGLLDGAESLERLKKDGGVFDASDVGDEDSELLGHGQEDFVVVVVVLGEERNELLPGPLFSEGSGDRGEAADRVQPQLDVLVLELVDQNRDWVQRLVHHGHLRREISPAR